jgi:hypothetical protein
MYMRITEERYSRDRRRFDLAFRMIGHEARTRTIRRWTGLSDDRIRKLYRSYVATGPGRAAKRHRGKSPTRTAFFLRNPENRRHTAALAGLFATLGVLREPDLDCAAGGTPAALRAAELFCQCYETYQAFYRSQRLTFEHGTYLLHVLHRSSELRPGQCPGCNAFMVVDALRTSAALCTWCESRARGRRGRPKESTA